MRHPLNRFSLRARLLLLTSVLLLTGLSLVSAAVSDQLERYQVGRLDSQLRSFTAFASRVPVAELPRFRDPTSTYPELLDPALDLIGAPYLVYLGPTGETVKAIHSSRLDVGTLPSHASLRTVPTTGAGVSLSAADASGRWRAVARPALGQTGTVIAAAPLTEIDATITRLRTSSVISGTVLLVLLTVIGWFALGRGLRPLRRIEHTAAAIAGGDLTSRVPELAAAHTEIGHLAESLNTMLGQLERAFADRAASEVRMRSFVSDVSHELRTPLFVIKGSTDLYRMGGLPDRAGVDAAMRRIGREANRLTTLTEGLLLLAQLDEAPEGQLDPGPMDLRTLAIDARHDLRALDPSRPVELTGLEGVGPPGPAPVHADEARLRQVVANLVGNAAFHTPPGTPVHLRVGTESSAGTGDRLAILEVADEGPGMTAEQAARAFDRFYRSDRSRNRPPGGCSDRDPLAGASAGLGLAIARSIARAHGGDVELITAPGRGARFRLLLPRLDQG